MADLEVLTKLIPLKRPRLHPPLGARQTVALGDGTRVAA